MKIKRGAPVMYRDPWGRLARGRIRSVLTWEGQRRVVIRGIERDTSSRVFKREDEGITWARGWTSRAARAMEVAEALAAK